MVSMWVCDCVGLTGMNMGRGDDIKSAISFDRKNCNRIDMVWEQSEMKNESTGSSSVFLWRPRWQEMLWAAMLLRFLKLFEEMRRLGCDFLNRGLWASHVLRSSEDENDVPCWRANIMLDDRTSLSNGEVCQCEIWKGVVFEGIGNNGGTIDVS